MYVLERFACRYVWASGMCLVPEEVRIGHQSPGNQAHALNCWIISLAPYLYWDRVSLWSWMPRDALAVASRALGSRMCVNMTSLSVSMLDCWAISSVPRKTLVWFCYVFFLLSLFCFYETVSHSVTQLGLGWLWSTFVAILLSLLPECWDYMCESLPIAS